MVKPYAPHPPSQRQREALAVDAEELLFGGAAGSGKSDYLWQAALQYVDVPGYTAVLFRLTEDAWKHPDSLLSRAREWLRDTPAKWDAGRSLFRFPSGASIAFLGGYNGNMDAFVAAHQGPGVHFAGFDELTQWPERPYRWFLGSRMRGLTNTPVPLRVRATANPGGKGFHWVRRRFLDFARNVATNTHVRDDLAARRKGVLLPSPAVYESPITDEVAALGVELGRKVRGACFVPGFASDNPGLNVDAYRLMLARLLPVDRERLEWGDWWLEDATTLFGPPVTYSTLPRLLRHGFGLDLSYSAKKRSDWSVCVHMAKAAGLTYVVDVTREHMRAPDFLAHVRPQHLAHVSAPWWWYAPGPEIGVADFFNEGGVPVVALPTKGDKFARAVRYAAAWNEGRVVLPESAPWLEELVHEHLSFTGLPSGIDDQVDAAVPAFDALDGDAVSMPERPLAPTHRNPYEAAGV